jgi:hypothetical protein
MLLAEWEALGTTEPFPMAAAGILLSYMNRTAADAGTCAAGGCNCCEVAANAATNLEHPPQRFSRRNAAIGLESCGAKLEPEPLGAGTDSGGDQPITPISPKGPV